MTIEVKSKGTRFGYRIPVNGKFPKRFYTEDEYEPEQHEHYREPHLVEFNADFYDSTAY